MKTPLSPFLFQASIIATLISVASICRLSMTCLNHGRERSRKSDPRESANKLRHETRLINSTVPPRTSCCYALCTYAMIRYVCLLSTGRKGARRPLLTAPQWTTTWKWSCGCSATETRGAQTRPCSGRSVGGTHRWYDKTYNLQPIYPNPVFTFWKWSFLSESGIFILMVEFLLRLRLWTDHMVTTDEGGKDKALQWAIGRGHTQVLLSQMVWICELPTVTTVTRVTIAVQLADYNNC